MRPLIHALVGVTSLALLACGDDSDPDAGVDAGVDAGPAELDASVDAGPSSDPPTVRDVRVDLSGVTALTVDLGRESTVLVLPEATPSDWIVQVRDDVTTPDALAVTLVHPDGSALADQSAAFERGNWRIAATVTPGDELTVRVEDADGNVTTHEPTLRIASLAEALADRWEWRDHDRDQAIIARAESVFDEDGTWTETGPAAGQGRTGSWTVTEGMLLLEERTRSDGDADATTVELSLEGPLYVDARFFARAAWRRVGAGTGAQGTFERTWERTEGGAAVSVEETLVLGSDGTYAWSRTVDGSADGEVEGTFEVELTRNYEDSLGDFLVITKTRVDGVDLASPETHLDIFIDVGDRLLIDPLIRVLP